MKIIARIKTDYKEKFGIPRQSGLTSARGLVVFEEEFRDENYIRGIKSFDYLWLIWQFSENAGREYSATVRPPKLGGREHWGVFATRSPFRPNALGLSSVKLVDVINFDNSKALLVEGVDMLDGTPIYDIKPYIPYSDIHEDAGDGFTKDTKNERMKVVFPDELLFKIPQEKRNALIETLALDPRPAHMERMDREYGMMFDIYNIKFRIVDDSINVTEIEILEALSGKLC